MKEEAESVIRRERIFHKERTASTKAQASLVDGREEGSCWLEGGQLRRNRYVMRLESHRDV